MEKIDQAVLELREMDDLAAMDSPIHRLHPLAKLLTSIAYIFLVVSFHKYDFSGLIVMVFYPVILYQVSGIPMGTCFRKLRIVLPLVCAVGLFNPLFDHTPMLMLGGVVISGGVISMMTLMIKGVLCLMASFLLAATTTIDAICCALRKLHVPSLMVTLILLTYRYISVMIDEVSVMTVAYQLRAPGQKGVHYSAWGSFLGQLLLRSMDRAEELYSSMQLRGFRGEFPYADVNHGKWKDWVYVLVCIAVLVLFRYCNVAELVGTLAAGGVR